ncbi:hypothetical protein BAUCODRAFT_255325 [Baudoinia panamericana UAMH 10762]|uniref:Alpha/beta hydrolase fold-3 domain-containing protein n=1 Tax=Baudoinia panamericana (strain UAMH 10762) TaxID=717646 RepID=M2N1T3_BAUPA|nr:uncharacterized protein BAUCODRAFT_255325 [Baudoinia panamericana UAMH 10762]EMC92610.1 hypothetical protein BAUCODRAFT_255325 [Baudoinia panamericana UAMH 10762]
MPLSTLGVVSAITPSVIETYFSHYLNRAPLKQKPTAHISYHEGLRLIREFLDYSSKHTVEDLQQFTSQWVPAPTWVRTYNNEIAPQFLERAARVIRSQLGPNGIEKVGGGTWWQWRRPESPLKAEWIEMKKDFNERKRAGTKCDRCILYVHGGAYYFGSVDEHRYQMQRHARKLKARVLAPRYRVAPQFPFPCGLMDCIATYFYLLEHFRPQQILIMGDSAGAAMVVSLLVVLRDQGCALPAGTVLLSPWVDLTHSFPSCAGDGAGDYIPPHGFHHLPSMAWPPPPIDSDKRLQGLKEKWNERHEGAVELPATAGLGLKSINNRPNDEDAESMPKKKSSLDNPLPGFGESLTLAVDGKVVEIKEQIQLYAPNDLLTHPLVSPVQQPSLGGLPPMLIQVGGAELVRDEQIYLAHKAANPKAFPPADAVLDEYDPRREILNRYPPTDVQLQVWEDLCHVPHTLSFTRPAKYMYRSVAQFGAWALAHAQQKGIDIQDDDAISVISSGPEDDGEDTKDSANKLKRKKTKTKASPVDDPGKEVGAVGHAGDPIPPFRDHMIRQRVTRHGVIYPMVPQAEIACLALDPATIGAIKPGPVRKWLAKKTENHTRYANEEKKLQKKRAKEVALGYDEIPGESPPLTALVRRRRKGIVPEEKKRGRSWGLAMWSGWGSSHDESTLEREEKMEKEAESRARTSALPDAKAETALTGGDQPGGDPDGTAKEKVLRKQRRTSTTSVFSNARSQREVARERPRSPYRQVTDTGQAGPRISPSIRSGSFMSDDGLIPTDRSMNGNIPTTGSLAPQSLQVPGSQNTYLEPGGSRPHNNISAYPFKLKQTGHSNPSVATLDSNETRMPSSQVSMNGEGSSIAPVEMPTPANEHAMPNELEPQEKEAEPVSAITPTIYGPAAGFPGVRIAQAEEEISPVEEPATISPVAPSFRSHGAVFDNRSSVLGKIGADGMPLQPFPGRKAKKPMTVPSPLAAALPENTVPPSTSTDETPPSPIAPEEQGHSSKTSKLKLRTQPDGLFTTPPNTDGAVDGVDGSPVTPIDNDKPVPFKIRNPVYDPRAGVSPTGASSTSPSEKASPDMTALTKPGEATDATKAAPFKLRHTVYDPSAGFGAAEYTQPPHMPAVAHASRTPSPKLSHAEEVANRAMTPIDLPPNANVVIPTVVARRPMALRQQTPPQIPVKDPARSTTPVGGGGIMDRKRSKELLKAESAATEKEAPVTKFGAPPVIGDLSFERGGFDFEDTRV